MINITNIMYKKFIGKKRIYFLMLFLIIIVSSLNLRNFPLVENIDDNESNKNQLLTEYLNSPKFASQWVSPVLLETFYIRYQQFNNMEIWNDLAFVAAGTQGFYIFNVSNPLNPYLIYHNPSVITYDMTISNNTLFTSSAEGFTSYNISDPINPQVMDSFFLSSGGGSAEKAYIVGEIAYVAYSERGLQIVNISNPSNMIRIDSYEEIDADIIDVHVINNLAYVACNAYGLKILNISDPADVQEVGFFNDYSSIKFVYASDDIAYASFYPEGIVAINVSDPVNPTEIWKYGGIGEFHGMLISNEIAYLSSYSEGFTLLNISNPQIPVQISNLYYPPFMAWGIDLYENIIYISSTAGYLYVIDPGFDTDEDNIPNIQEQLVYGLDINDPDCDDDGLIDGDEVSIYGTNPQSNDTDNDLLWDFDEINVYSTNPLSNDTDNDLLWDFDEINVYSTNPLSNDTDNDLLWDFDEINVYSTNPLSMDSDEDGFNDGIEVAANTDPNNDLSYPTDGDNYRWQEFNIGDNIINCIDNNGSLWLNSYFSSITNGFIRLTHNISNFISVKSPEDVDFKDFYQIDFYNSSDHLESLNINLYLSANQYSEEEIENLRVFRFNMGNASWYQINSTFFLDEMKFLILDTEIEEKTLYAIGKIDESEISNPNIPGFPFEFLSIFIIIGVFLILKKKSFMTVKKK